MKIFATNKRAYFDYEILETHEAGLALFGFEVKAIKTGHINLAGSYVIIRDNEAWLLNASVPPYQPANIRIAYDPLRTRKLLLHSSELRELIGKSSQKGLTLVPFRVYAKKSKIKIEIGLARNKKKQDKRETIKKRESEREIERTMKI